MAAWTHLIVTLYLHSYLVVFISVLIPSWCVYFSYFLSFSLLILASYRAHKVTNKLENVGNLQHLCNITITVAIIEKSKTFSSKAVIYTVRFHVTCLLIFLRLAENSLVFRILVKRVLWNFTTIRQMGGLMDEGKGRHIGDYFNYSSCDSVQTSWNMNYWASRFEAVSIPKRDTPVRLIYRYLCTKLRKAASQKPLIFVPQINFMNV